MDVINIADIANGESKSIFEKISDTEVLEIVVAKRIRKIADLQVNADDIDSATAAKEEKILKDKAHTAELRNIIASKVGDIKEIKATH